MLITLKNRILLLWQAVLVFSFLPVQAQAGVLFRSAELERLVTELHVNVDSLSDGTHLFDVKGRKVVVSVQCNMVQSVGYQLFSDELKTAVHSPVPAFLERYFLSLDYPQKDRPRDRMLREDRFFFKKGTLAVVATLRPDDAFSFDYEQKRYVATWSRDDKQILSVSFPATHELLSGESKLEAENNVENDIMLATLDYHDVVDESVLLPTLQKNFLLRRGGTYLGKLFSSDLFYQRQNDSLVLVSDVSHPLESVANMLINPAFQSSLNLKFQQVLYGYKRKSFDVPLKNWIAYCMKNDCELYYGIESFDNKEVKATVVAVNVAENYNHLLYLTIPVQTIDTGWGDISGTLQTFIPMHNVKSLVAQYKKVEKRKRKYE